MPRIWTDPRRHEHHEQAFSWVSRISPTLFPTHREPPEGLSMLSLELSHPMDIAAIIFEENFPSYTSKFFSLTDDWLGESLTGKCGTNLTKTEETFLTLWDKNDQRTCDGIRVRGKNQAIVLYRRTKHSQPCDKLWRKMVYTCLGEYTNRRTMRFS